MGLVTCGECGKEVSNVAKYCPSCGFTAGKYVGKSKGLAVVLALFLGGLGIHKFYLGKIWLGFLYLIFCWTFIPVILGVIDAIVLATKNEREFSGAVVTAKAPKNAEALSPAKAPKNAEALSPAKAPKNEPKQGSGSLQNPKMREDLRSALEMAGFHRRVILSKGIQANEHIPDDAKVLCALLTEDGMQLLLNTGILRLELKKTRAVAELIPFTALSKASVRKSLGTSYVDIQTLKSHPGVLSGFTPKSENAYRFEELYSNINPLAAKKTKLREDFARAKGYGPDHVPDDLDIAMESYIPEDSEVLYLIGDLGVFMLLDTGVLRLKLKLFGGPISGSEFVPLAQIKGVTVKDRNPGYAVEVRREEGSVVIAGSSFKTSDFFGLTGSKDEALKFQKMLLALLGSPSSNPKSSENAVGKISQLKELLDAGAITQDEFDAKKKKLMDSI